MRRTLPILISSFCFALMQLAFAQDAPPAPSAPPAAPSAPGSAAPAPTPVAPAPTGSAAPAEPPKAQQPPAPAPADPSATAPAQQPPPPQPAPATPPAAAQPAPTPAPTTAPTQDAKAPAAANASATLAVSGTTEPKVDGAKDKGAESSKIPARNYDALPLSLEFRTGLNSRLGGSDAGFSREELNDLGVGFGGFLTLSREFSAGLELEYTGLGRASGSAGDSTVNAFYSASSLWAGVRAFPWRSETIDLFLSLRAGLALQHMSANGTRHDDVVGAPARPFSCSETDGPGIGFGGGIGAAFRLSQSVAFLTRLDANAQNLSGEVLGNCAVGVGATTSAQAMLGVAYEFELNPKSKQSARR